MHITVRERLRSGRRPLTLVALVVAGVVLHHTGIFDWYRFLGIAEEYAHRWWFPAALVVVKGAMYAFALPGSVMFWLPGLFYHPVIAAAILVAGGVAGALAAYVLARNNPVSFDPTSRSARLFSFFRANTDLPTLTAMRALPGFPHSIINFGSGLLSVPVGRFLLASAVGFAVKGYLYSAAVHRTAAAEDAAEIASAETLLPLLGLALLFAAGRLFFRRSVEDEGKRDA